MKSEYDDMLAALKMPPPGFFRVGDNIRLRVSYSGRIYGTVVNVYTTDDTMRVRCGVGHSLWISSTIGKDAVFDARGI